MLASFKLDYRLINRSERHFGVNRSAAIIHLAIKIVNGVVPYECKEQLGMLLRTYRAPLGIIEYAVNVPVFDAVLQVFRSLNSSFIAVVIRLLFVKVSSRQLLNCSASVIDKPHSSVSTTRSLLILVACSPLCSLILM